MAEENNISCSACGKSRAIFYLWKIGESLFCRKCWTHLKSNDGINLLEVKRVVAVHGQIVESCIIKKHGYDG